MGVLSEVLRRARRPERKVDPRSIFYRKDGTRHRTVAVGVKRAGIYGMEESQIVPSSAPALAAISP